MKTRILSALLLILICVPLLVIGGIPFDILVLLVSIMALYEIFKVRKTKKKIPFGMELCSYILVAFLTMNNYQSTNLVISIDYRLVAFMIFFLLFPIVFINDNKKYNVDDALFLIGATLFIGLSLNMVILLRNYDLNYVLYVLLISCITDTFALVTGTLIGRNKVCPKISPKKTIEGCVGGSVMGTAVSVIFFITCINPSIKLSIIIGVTFILTIIGQIGDLVFSAIKRYYGLKDFSNLIPGHGGVLDRLDSSIFVVLGLLLFMVIL